MIKKFIPVFLLSFVFFTITTLKAQEAFHNAKETLTQQQTQSTSILSPQLEESKKILEIITNTNQKIAIPDKNNLFYIYFPGIKFEKLVSSYSNLSNFQKFLELNKLKDKLFLLATALKSDATNPSGFLSDGLNNWKMLKNKFQKLYNTFKKDTRREIRDEYFLLGICYKILFEYINTHIFKYENQERALSFSLLKELYFSTNICEQKSLSRLVTNTLKTAKNSTPFLTSLGYAQKEFANASAFINFIKINLNISIQEQQINLEKKELIKLLFKMGFIFNLYGDNFKKLSQELPKVEYEKFLSELLFHIIKIQNNIQAKKTDKNSLRAYFNTILLTALREIFPVKLKLISFSEFKKGNLQNAIQIFFMILITNNNIEYQLHKKNIATFKKVMMAGLGIIIMSTAVGMMAIIPAVPAVAIPIITAFTFAPQEIGFDFLVDRGVSKVQESKKNLKEQLVITKTESIFFANYIISTLENLSENIAAKIKNTYVTFLAEPGIIKSIASKIKNKPEGNDLAKKFVIAAMTKVAEVSEASEIKKSEEEIETLAIEKTEYSSEEQVKIKSDIKQLKHKLAEEKQKRLELENKVNEIINILNHANLTK